jgi:hypothetical protein
VAPVIDGVLTGYEAFRVGYAALSSDRAYARSPIDRKTDLWLGVGFGALFLGSTIYGVVATSRCQRLKDGPGPDEPTPGISLGAEPRAASLLTP